MNSSGLKLFLGLIATGAALLMFQNCQKTSGGAAALGGGTEGLASEQPFGTEENLEVTLPVGGGESGSCGDNPVTGGLCASGTIYVGQYKSKTLLITPPGCGPGVNPQCDGGEDAMRIIWHGTAGEILDIPTLTNVLLEVVPDVAGESGLLNSQAIAASDSVSPDSAADYCLNLEYGGFNDWFLPSKSEMAFIYCQAISPDHENIYPQEDPSCTIFGGKKEVLEGFNFLYYWTSTEVDNDKAWAHYTISGAQLKRPKASGAAVRCARFDD